MNNKNNILVLPGDGIGPEVCDEAIKVLKHLNDIYKLDFKLDFINRELSSNPNFYNLNY